MDFALRVAGGAAMVLAGIGVACLFKYLVQEVGRALFCKTLRQLLIGEWRPGVEFKHAWQTDWWWCEQKLIEWVPPQHVNCLCAVVTKKEVEDAEVHVLREEGSEVRGEDVHDDR